MKNIIDLNIIKVGNSIACGSYCELLNRYKYVINFKAGDKVASLCTDALCPGPFRIIVDASDLDEIESFSLSESELILNNKFRLAFSPQQLYRQPRIRPNTPGQLKNILVRNLINELLEADELNLLKLVFSPPLGVCHFDKELRKCFLGGLTAYYKHDETGFVGHIKGRGTGSTPAGDDFLLGYLIGVSWLIEACGIDLKAHRDIVYRAALGSNHLLNTFLHQAYTYQLDKLWADFLNSLADNRINRLMNDFHAVMNLGGSSGEDMISGFCFLLLDRYPKIEET
jgi:hypothetical protein